VAISPEFAPPAQLTNTLMVGGAFTVIVFVVVFAHNPAVGVNVYTVVVVLLNAGDQVPVIDGVFVLDVSHKGIATPEQYGPTLSKVGVTFGVIATIVVAVLAHCPAAGVKV
jgi:hypothetical protein